MLSQLPTDIEKMSPEMRDKEILRVGMVAELDAINFYEQMAELAQNPKIKKALYDIAREEKTHTHEFQTLLMELDQEYAKEKEEAEKEISEM